MNSPQYVQDLPPGDAGRFDDKAHCGTQTWSKKKETLRACVRATFVVFMSSPDVVTNTTRQRLRHHSTSSKKKEQEEEARRRIKKKQQEEAIEMSRGKLKSAAKKTERSGVKNGNKKRNKKLYGPGSNSPKTPGMRGMKKKPFTADGGGLRYSGSTNTYLVYDAASRPSRNDSPMEVDPDVSLSSLLPDRRLPPCAGYCIRLSVVMTSGAPDRPTTSSTVRSETLADSQRAGG